MLTGKQKRYLRSLAMKNHATMQVGKSGMTESFINQFLLELEKQEMVKISLLQNTDEDTESVISDIKEVNQHVQLVQKIGRNLVFYKKANEKKHRKLSPHVDNLK